MERSEIRERHASRTVHPDYAALHPGYKKEKGSGTPKDAVP
jgi:hypothetical protein